MLRAPPAPHSLQGCGHLAQPSTIIHAHPSPSCWEPAPGDQQPELGRPPKPTPPTLPVCALHPGLPQMGSLPRTVPSSSHVPLAGVEGKASGSHWLPFAVSRAPNEHTVISRASRPAPSQNTATLGEALYSQRQTTHICFLTVGIAPSGTGGTGNPLSPSPCD